MLAFAAELEKALRDYKDFGHPLDLTHEWTPIYRSIAAEIVSGMKLAAPMPVLAQLVAASPFEAAIHDAQGKTLGKNSYNLLGPEFVEHDLARWLTPEFAGDSATIVDPYVDVKLDPAFTLRAGKVKGPIGLERLQSGSAIGLIERSFPIPADPAARQQALEPIGSSLLE